VKQQRLLQRLGHRFLRHRLEGDHGKMAAGDAFLEIDLAVTRHRRRPDQEFRQHHEEDRQQQQPK
jgi:hypothetical protein